MSARGRAFAIVILAGAAGLAPAAGAQGRSLPTYEPQQRARTGLDTCLKTEVMRNAACVRKCESGFRMDLSGTRPRCIGLKPDAKYTPPPPSYQPAPADPSRKRPAQGGMG